MRLILDIKIKLWSKIMSDSTENKETTPSTYSLDGKPITLMELNEARNKPGIKIVEVSSGTFKTLQRLNG